MNNKKAYEFLTCRQGILKGEIEELEDFVNKCLVRFAKVQAENLISKKRRELVAINAILEEANKAK